MNETQLLTLATTLVAALFGLLCAILGWVGNKLFSKLEDLAKGMSEISSELHEKVNGIDRRLTVVETRCSAKHHLTKE